MTVAPKPVAPAAPIQSKLTPVHPALQPPVGLKSPSAPAVPAAIRPPSLVAPRAPGFGFRAPAAPIGSRQSALGYRPEAPLPFSYRRSVVPPPQRGFWSRLFHPEPTQAERYYMLQRAAERRALVDSLIPEQTLPPEVFVSPPELAARSLVAPPLSPRAWSPEPGARLLEVPSREHWYEPWTWFQHAAAAATPVVQDVDDTPLDDDSTDVSAQSPDDDSNPDLDSPQDSVAGDVDVIFAQDYGMGRRYRPPTSDFRRLPTSDFRRRIHHHDFQQGQSSFVPAPPLPPPAQSAFAPPIPPPPPPLQQASSSPGQPPGVYGVGWV